MDESVLQRSRHFSRTQDEENNECLEGKERGEKEKFQGMEETIKED